MGNSVPVNEENAKLCLCQTCPTYKNSGLSGNVFCASGKASSKPKTSGCICPNCPIYKTYSLDQMYYCIQGRSADIKA